MENYTTNKHGQPCEHMRNSKRCWRAFLNWGCAVNEGNLAVERPLGTRGASALCCMSCCSLGEGNHSKFANHGFGDFPASPSFTLSLFSLAFGCVFVFVSLSLLSTCRITFSRQETVEPLLRLSFKIVTAKETPVPQKGMKYRSFVQNSFSHKETLEPL